MSSMSAVPSTGDVRRRGELLSLLPSLPSSLPKPAEDGHSEPRGRTGPKGLPRVGDMELGVTHSEVQALPGSGSGGYWARC